MTDQPDNLAVPASYFASKPIQSNRTVTFRRYESLEPKLHDPRIESKTVMETDMTADQTNLTMLAEQLKHTAYHLQVHADALKAYDRIADVPGMFRSSLLEDLAYYREEVPLLLTQIETELTRLEEHDKPTA